MVEIPLPPHSVQALRAALLAQGLQPVAVYNRAKRPFGDHWQQTKGMPVFVAAAQSTGILCNGVRGIDIDISDAAAADRAAAIVADTCGPSPFVRGRPDSAKRLILYRGSGKKRVIKTDAGKVEILGDGQQFVAYGIHPDGAPYEWFDEEPASVKLNGQLVKETDLDRLEKALHAALGGSAPDDPVPSFSGPKPEVAHAWAQTALDEEARRVASAAPGTRNDELNRSAFNLGQIVAGGALDRSIVQDALRNAAAACGLGKDDGWPQVNRTITSGLASGAKEPRRAPERAIEVPATVVEAAALMVARTKPKKEDIFAAIQTGRGVDWRTPRGLIGQISDWILETSRRPNRALAVASATAILSAVCGRHLYGPTGTALNLYIVTLAKTGAGKDRPLSAVGEFLTAAKLPLAQTAKAFSVSGFERLIAENPCCVATIDEMGANLLARIANKRASHEAGEGIKAALQELWSRVYGKSPFQTTRRAQAASEAVSSPSLTLFGASTPEAFYDCFRAGDALSGFLNRFLIAEGDGRAKVANEFDYFSPNLDLIDGVRSLIPEQDGNLGDVMGVYRAPAVVERKMRWAPDVKQEALDLENALGDLAEAHPRGELMARTFEYSVRLASLHAVSQTRLAVDHDDLAWGASWALGSARAMITAANDLMAETEYESFVNRVKAIIRKEGTIGRSDLMRRCQFLRARDLDGIIDQLAQAEIIEKLDVRTSGRGAPGRSYRWIG